jgi:hypothetical protein
MRHQTPPGDNLKAVYQRVALLAALITPALVAQFSGLSPTAGGSSLYFASTLRLKSLGQPLNGKIYVSRQAGVSLFRARESSPPPDDALPCTAGGFADYVAAETSYADVVALRYRAQGSSRPCSYPPNLYMTRIVTASGETDIRGIARLSTRGRYGIVFLGATGRIDNAVSISFLDLQNGTQTPITLTAPVFPQFILQPLTSGRVIANDGTAVVAITSGSGGNGGGYLVKPGVEPVPFPIPDCLPLIIDGSGSKVL